MDKSSFTYLLNLVEKDIPVFKRECSSFNGEDWQKSYLSDRAESIHANILALYSLSFIVMWSLSKDQLTRLSRLQKFSPRSEYIYALNRFRELNNQLFPD